MVQSIWFFNWNFRFSDVNGKNRKSPSQMFLSRHAPSQETWERSLRDDTATAAKDQDKSEGYGKGSTPDR